MIEKLKAEVAALKEQLIQNGITPIANVPKPKKGASGAASTASTSTAPS